MKKQYTLFTEENFQSPRFSLRWLDMFIWNILKPSEPDEKSVVILTSVGKQNCQVGIMTLYSESTFQPQNPECFTIVTNGLYTHMNHFAHDWSGTALRVNCLTAHNNTTPQFSTGSSCKSNRNLGRLNAIVCIAICTEHWAYITPPPKLPLQIWQLPVSSTALCHDGKMTG